MPDLIRLEYRDVTMRFAQSAGPLTAVSGVSIQVRDCVARDSALNSGRAGNAPALSFSERNGRP